MLSMSTVTRAVLAYSRMILRWCIPAGDSTQTFYGIFDGHGGDGASTCVNGIVTARILV